MVGHWVDPEHEINQGTIIIVDNHLEFRPGGCADRASQVDEKFHLTGACGALQEELLYFLNIHL